MTNVKNKAGYIIEYSNSKKKSEIEIELLDLNIDKKSSNILIESSYFEGKTQ